MGYLITMLKTKIYIQRKNTTAFTFVFERTLEFAFAQQVCIFFEIYLYVVTLIGVTISVMNV